MVTILEHSFNFNGFNCYVILRHMGGTRLQMWICAGA